MTPELSRRLAAAVQDLEMEDRFRVIHAAEGVENFDALPAGVRQLVLRAEKAN